MKTLAVLLPTYNAAAYIEHSMDSILNQTFTDFDLFVYDDCSTDHTEALVRGYKNPRVHYKKNKENLGIAKTLNRGLNALLPYYEYVARMDADDWAYPERFKKQLDYLEQHQDVVMCGTQGYWIKDMALHPESGWEYPVRHAYIRYYLLFAATFNHQSVIFKSRFLLAHQLQYDESIATCEDWEFWTRIIKKGKLVNLSEFLMKCRILPFSNHHSPLHRDKHLQERSKIISDYWAHFNMEISPKQIFDFYYSEDPVSKQQFIYNTKILIQNFNALYTKASHDLTIEECRSFSYMLARRILNYWKRAKLSRFDVVIWWHIVREVTFMNTLKLIKSIMR
jgi:glycosyltransferase involved in cell wall biosynthesis